MFARHHSKLSKNSLRVRRVSCTTSGVSASSPGRRAYPKVSRAGRGPEVMPAKSKMKMLEMSPLMSESAETPGELTLNHAGYDQLSKTLQMPMGGQSAPKPPASLTDGEIYGALMHQGKFRGAWKKAYFVLKGPYLFQYANEKATMPKKAYYVSYCLTERMAAEALAEETSAKYMEKLEEKACSLRINVYTPDKTKVLTASSEDTMNAWVAKLDESVAASCSARPGMLEAKKDAAEKMKPLMMAQTFAEVDTYHTLVSNLKSAGLLAGDDDPRHSDEIAKAGKMKMLKSTMDENVWQKFYFVMVDKTIYYYKSRKKKDGNYDDDDEEEEDDEDTDDMPWKGCLNVTVATVGAAPTAISSKAKVFQIKTPLRTFILKARHEVDAEEWMGHICAAQQGIPVENRESKLRGFDVYNDRLADKLKSNPDSVQLSDLLQHPVGVRYFMQFLATSDGALAKSVKCFKGIEKYKKKVVPEKKLKKALKIFKKFIKGSEYIPKEVQAEIASQVENFDFAAQNMFQPVEDILKGLCEAKFNDFKQSPIFETLLKSCGPKMVTVSREKKSDETHPLGGCVVIGRSRESDAGDDYIHLPEDHKVSREHCRIDAGPLAVLITDMGSSKGTRLDSKDGKKVMSKIILPGQALYIGGYVLTYQLGQAPAKKKKSGGIFGSMFGKKK